MTIQLLTGDCRDVLPTLPSNSVHCVVTSPPYYGLRDYGTAQWEGGAEGCDHIKTVYKPAEYVNDGGAYRSNNQSWKGGERNQSEPYGHVCGKCGARRIDRQLGLETTPDEYLAAMVGVFREIRRVMRDDACAFVNMGDSYNSKQLLLMPARLALALQADGWWVRSDIIWAKPNPMPESCTDRPTSAHEHVFLLTKAARYFFDADAVREEPTGRVEPLRFGRVPVRNDGASVYNCDGTRGRNLRNVWTIATHAFPEAHFATYPPELVERCIKAGTSEKGCCAACGAPWVRVTERSVAFTSGSGRAGNKPNGKYAGSEQAESGEYDIRMGPSVATTTTGWAPSCQCQANYDCSGLGCGHQPCICIGVQPCTVLDPFLGSGTTALVADRLQRNCIGIDLSLTYAGMAQRRLEADCPLFTSWAPAEDPEDERMRDLFAEAAE
jgi:DNA modification methylase